jgi:hypothetical protein
MAFSKNMSHEWVITGGTAEKFVEKADKNYQDYLERKKKGIKKTPEEERYSNWVKETVKNVLTS